MLDIKFLRENPEVVKQNIRNKFQDQSCCFLRSHQIVEFIVITALRVIHLGAQHDCWELAFVFRI